MRARRFNAAAAGSGPRIAPRCGRRPSSHRELSISLTPDARGLDIFTIYDLSWNHESKAKRKHGMVRPAPDVGARSESKF